jgi:hypothetical protein
MCAMMRFLAPLVKARDFGMTLDNVILPAFN